MTGKVARMEDIDAEKLEKMAVELLRGKDSAVQLQTLLLKGCDLRKPRAASSKASPGELVRRILRSFSRVLSELTEPTRISEEKKKKKGRRGCYKRRRTSDSRVVESTTLEDGQAWRKYGQKTILNSLYPRCYYKCTHKPQGCKAMKQVQAIRDNPVLYQTMYFHHHTCSSRMAATPSARLAIQYSSSSEQVESSNVISFQTKKCDLPAKAPMMNPRIDPPKSENVSEETLSDWKSSSTLLYDVPWDEMADLDEPEWAHKPAPSSHPCHDLGDFGNMFLFGGDVKEWSC